MSGPVVLDTSAIISVVFPEDANHERAKQHAQALVAAERVIVLPGDVITETVNLTGKKFGHDQAAALAAQLLTSRLYTRVESGDQLRVAALKYFRRQSSSVSFTDCIVMAVADAYHTKDIFGFDADFTRNGYQIVPY